MKISVTLHQCAKRKKSLVPEDAPGQSSRCGIDPISILFIIHGAKPQKIHRKSRWNLCALFAVGASLTTALEVK